MLKQNRFLLFGALLAMTAFRPPTAAPPNPGPEVCGVRCGVERWPVKTVTDSDAYQVRLKPQHTTVAALRAFHAPPRDSLSNFHRYGAVERSAWAVNAVVLCWKLEADRDFHIVIADSNDTRATMIVEVPDAHCRLVCASSLAARITDARAAVLVALGKPSAGCKELRSPASVVVAGIGFLDYDHGQTGVAPNGVELHPVTAIAFAHPRGTQ